MMKEARRVGEKAIDSLVLSIEHFNRPWDRGRTDAVLIRRVNELDFYSVGAAQLAEKVGLTQPKSRAVVDHLGLREDTNYFKEIKIGSVTHARYSPKAIQKIRNALTAESIDVIWTAYRAKQRAAK